MVRRIRPGFVQMLKRLQALQGKQRRAALTLCLSLIVVIGATTMALVIIPDDPMAPGATPATVASPVALAPTPLPSVSSPSFTSGQWMPVALPFAQDVTAIVANGGTSLFACGSAGRADHTIALAQSSDGGAHWRASATTIPGAQCAITSSTDGKRIALAARQCPGACGATDAANVYRSDDSGATWRQCVLPDNGRLTALLAWSGTTLVLGTLNPHEPLAVSVSAGHCAYAADATRFLDAAGGQTRQITGVGDTVFAVLALGVAPTPTPTTTQLAILQSANGGAIWTLAAQHAGQPITFIRGAADGQALLGQMADGALAVSLDLGQTWQRAKALPGNSTFVADFADRLPDGHLIAHIHSADTTVDTLSLSTDSGWQSIATLPAFTQIRAITVDDHGRLAHIWVVGNSGGLQVFSV
jgi:hypothetical protein